MGTSRLKAEENRNLSADGHPWRGCKERAQLPKVIPRELEKAAWFPKLSSGSRSAAPGSPPPCSAPGQRRRTPKQPPRAPRLESGSRMGTFFRSHPHCPGLCAPRDGAVRGHPCAPHPAGGVPALPGAAASLMDLVLLAAVALAHAAPRGGCRSSAAAVAGLSSPTGSWGAGGGRKPGSALGLGEFSPPSVPGLSAGRGRSPGMR